MPLPTIEECQLEPDPCCQSIWRIADGLLQHVYADLIACLPTPAGCDAPVLDGFVSHGPPAVTTGDYLAVWVAGIQPDFRSLSPAGSIIGPAQMRATWNVRLLEEGYPSIEGGTTITEPTVQYLNAVNRHLYGHGEVMLRSAINSKAVVFGDCTSIAFSEMRALTPGSGSAFAGTAGFELSITATLDLR